MDRAHQPTYENMIKLSVHHYLWLIKKKIASSTIYIAIVSLGNNKQKHIAIKRNR